MKYLGLAIILILVFVFAGQTDRVFAIANPDDMEILAITAYRGVLEDEDILVIVKYNIEYATPPTELASQTFLFRFTDGVTTFNSTVPYPYNDNGYNQGIVSFYWDAATVDSLGLVWESASYKVVLAGNPTFFPALPPVENSSIVWRSELATMFHLRNDILTLARELELEWGVDLVASTPEGNLLTNEGDEYFTNSIDNLRLMLPNIFLSRTESVSFPEETFTKSYAEELKDFWDGTDLDAAFNSLATLLDVPRIMLTTIILIVLGMFVAFSVIKVTGQPAIGLMSFTVILLAGTLVGMTELVLIAIIAAAGVLGIFYVIFYRQSA